MRAVEIGIGVFLLIIMLVQIDTQIGLYTDSMASEGTYDYEASLATDFETVDQLDATTFGYLSAHQAGTNTTLHLVIDDTVIIDEGTFVGDLEWNVSGSDLIIRDSGTSDMMIRFYADYDILFMSEYTISGVVDNWTNPSVVKFHAEGIPVGEPTGRDYTALLNLIPVLMVGGTLAIVYAKSKKRK